MSQTKQALLKLILDRGYERRDEAFKLSSGEWSHDYIDAKRAISTGDGLKLAGEALIELSENAGANFEAVGGLTMGADALAHSVSILSGASWFSVRKEAKSHGQRRLIEGADLQPGTRVFLLDDVISTGASILKALDALEEGSIEVCLATSLVDRGKTAKQALESRGLQYRPLLTFEDLGIGPISSNEENLG